LQKGETVSFVITLYVREGVVMASDSRLTLSTERRKDGKQVTELAVSQSDSTYKTFSTPTNIGISTFGAADVQGVPIAGYIESFIDEHLSRGEYVVDQVPREMLTYFRSFPAPPDTGFLVAGYKCVENVAQQHVWEVIIKTKKIARLNQPGSYGAVWRGETDIMTRLIQPVRLQHKSGTSQSLPHHPIEWGFFTLQDAINYAIYAVKVTIDTMRFHPRPKTVGGPIDVLVIKPNKSFWVRHKTLHA